VDADAAGSADGLTWSTAFTNVQDALTSAGPEDEIWVAEGVYTPTNAADRTATFQLEDGVALYGGFVATETLRTQRDWETHVTVLSGDLDGNDTTDASGVVTSTANITGTNAYHVTTGSGVTETARLDGFTVTAGKADSGWPHSEGGGMANYSSSNPTLANVTFSGNTATCGGGMTNWSSSPRLANCILWGNSDSGGADQSAQIHIGDASPITVTYSLVQGGVYTGTGNISADPQFVRDPDPGDGDWTTLADNDYGDLRLQPSSPTIDAGDNAALPADVTDLDDDGNTTEPIPLDLAGDPRILGSRVDMGAYEAAWQHQVFLPLVLKN